MVRRPRVVKDSNGSVARQVVDFIRVNPDAPLPLAAQLQQQLEWLLSSGQIKPGERLPPVRALAEQLGIHRHTVLAAYQQLEVGGLLAMRQGRGSVVLPYAVESLVRQSATVPTFTVGVLVPGLNPFYTPFLRGIEETARAGPWLLLVCYTHDEPRLASRYLDQLVARQVDGLIVAAGLPATEGESKNLPPVVHVDKPKVRGNVILLDSERAGFLATRHLLEHGHRRIGLITGALTWSNVRECYAGYKRALRSAGLEVQTDYVVEAPDFALEAGHAAAQRLLQLSDPPTAIFGAADVLAIGAMQAIEERGLRVPEDVAVVGYNNIDLAALVKPALTTVHAPSYDMGVAAMTMLLDLLAGRSVKQPRVKLPTRLIVRRSCGCHGQHVPQATKRRIANETVSDWVNDATGHGTGRLCSAAHRDARAGADPYSHASATACGRAHNISDHDSAGGETHPRRPGHTGAAHC